MNCDFTLLKEDTSWLMAMICLAAVITVALDIGVWRKDCEVLSTRSQASINAYMKGCAK
jgi:hypothetical protein